jgi:hypothetical protein
MKFLILILLVLNTALADCHLKKKGISHPMPEIPVSISVEENWKEAFQASFEVLCENLKTPNNSVPTLGHRIKRPIFGIRPLLLRCGFTGTQTSLKSLLSTSCASRSLQGKFITQS